MQGIARSSSDLAGLRTWFVRLQRAELAVVRFHVRFGRAGLLRPVAIGLNYLGNGWLYPLVLVLVLWLYPPQFPRIAICAAVAAGTAHVLYRWIKRRFARPRPCELHPDLPPLVPALDRYSFPSGHCMTVTAVAVPVAAAFPALTFIAVLTCLLVAWARLVAGHHYPSDLVAGALVGALVSAPITFSLL